MRNSLRRGAVLTSLLASSVVGCGNFRNYSGDGGNIGSEAVCNFYNGEWAQWGRSSEYGCNLRTSDYGIPCDDSREDCVGYCSPIEEGSLSGECSEFRIPYGCHDRIDNGTVSEECVD